MATLLGYYRSLFHPLAEPFYSFLSFVLPFHIPASYKDLFLLAFLFGLICMRVVPDITGRKERLAPSAQNFVNVLSALMLAVPLPGLAAPIVLVISATSSGPLGRSGADDLKRFLLSLGCMMAATFTFHRPARGPIGRTHPESHS